MRRAIDIEVFNNAVEEYERINRTNVKETKQYQDLLKEKNLLYKRIVELTKNEEGKEMKKKVIDLSNTWCEATERNYLRLLELGIKITDWTFHEGVLAKGMNIINIANNKLAFNDYESHLSKRQIHLVSGEFEYVTDTNVGEVENKSFKEEHEKVTEIFGEETCCFKKHGFEVPEFECEILKEVKGNKINGTKRFLGHIINDEGISYPCIFEEWGECNFCTSVHSEDFKLTPLKKPWYEDESNFPCVVKNIDTGELHVSLKLSSEDNSKIYVDCKPKDVTKFKPATEEEVLQLVIN